MGAPQFTPGPWHVSEALYGSGTQRHILARESVHPVARTFGDPRSSVENAANARLIAAAPELYEALSEVVTLLEGWHRLNFADEIQQQSVRLAKRALAKARGEQEASK